MSWYQRARHQFGMFVAREYPTTIEECFRTPVVGAIYAELIDRLRAQGAIRPAVVDTSALVHSAWDLGSPTQHRGDLLSDNRCRDPRDRL